MGQESSTAASGSGGATAATAAASPALTSGEPIFVNVYEPATGKENVATSVPGFGVWHSGVEVFGTEYVFAGGMGSSTGVYSQRVRWQANGSPWKYKESVQVGFTALNKDGVKKLVKELEPEFVSSKYHLTDCNCNHFSERMCVALGVGDKFPAWINRAAKTGSSIAGMLGIDPMKVAAQIGGGANGGPVGQPLEAIKPVLEIVDLLPQLDAKAVSCLNQSASAGIENVLVRDNNKKFLSSDCDEQMLIFLPFKKIVKMHALTFGVYYPDSVNAKHNPKTIKLFANARNMDFTDAPTATPSMTLQVDALISATLKLQNSGSDKKKAASGADDLLVLTVALPLVKFQVNTFIV